MAPKSPDLRASLEELALAFTEWRRRYEEEPRQFMLDAEVYAVGTQSYGEACAPYLMAIVAEMRG